MNNFLIPIRKIFWAPETASDIKGEVDKIRLVIGYNSGLILKEKICLSVESLQESPAEMSDLNRKKEKQTYN